jgi:hypothetical protein
MQYIVLYGSKRTSKLYEGYEYLPYRKGREKYGEGKHKLNRSH